MDPMNGDTPIDLPDLDDPMAEDPTGFDDPPLGDTLEQSGADEHNTPVGATPEVLPPGEDEYGFLNSETEMAVHDLHLPPAATEALLAKDPGAIVAFLDEWNTATDTQREDLVAALAEGTTGTDAPPAPPEEGSDDPPITDAPPAPPEGSDDPPIDTEPPVDQPTPPVQGSDDPPGDPTGGPSGPPPVDDSSTAGQGPPVEAPSPSDGLQPGDGPGSPPDEPVAGDDTPSAQPAPGVPVDGTSPNIPPEAPPGTGGAAPADSGEPPAPPTLSDHPDIPTDLADGLLSGDLGEGLTAFERLPEEPTVAELIGLVESGTVDRIVISNVDGAIVMEIAAGPDGNVEPDGAAQPDQLEPQLPMASAALVEPTPATGIDLRTGVLILVLGGAAGAAMGRRGRE